MKSDSIKTIVVVNDFNYIEGGASKVAIQTANLLVNEGYEVIFFSGKCSNKKELDSRVNDYCLNIEEAMLEKNRFLGMVRGLYNLKAKKEMTKMLSTLDLNSTIVHVHGWTKCLSSSVFSSIFKSGFRCLLTMHDYFTACPNGGYFNFKKNAICTLKPMGICCICSNCDSRNYFFKIYRLVRQFIQNNVVKLRKKIKDVVVLSHFSENVLRKTLYPWTRIHFVANPIDLDPKVSKINAKKNKYFLFVGRVTKEKGVELFARAVSELNVKGIVVGSGNDLVYLKNKYPNVEYVGWKSSDEVKKYIKGAKALVFPSLWYEVAPLTPLEAMQYSIPCIVSNCSAARDYIDSSNGRLFEDYDELVECIAKFDKWYHDFDFNMKDNYVKNICEVYRKMNVDGADE